MNFYKDYYSIVEVSKELNCDKFDLVYLGAFDDLKIYIYLSNQTLYPRGTVISKNEGVSITGYFPVIKKTLSDIYSKKEVKFSLNQNIEQDGKWFMFYFSDSLELNSPEMLYVRISDFEKLKTEDKQRKNNEVIDLSPIPKDGITRRDIQLEIIMAVIKALNYDLNQIPDGGKAKIKVICLTRNRYFTNDGFDHAWKQGISESLFKMKNHDKFANR